MAESVYHAWCPGEQRHWCQGEARGRGQAGRGNRSQIMQNLIDLRKGSGFAVNGNGEDLSWTPLG